MDSFWVRLAGVASAGVAFESKTLPHEAVVLEQQEGQSTLVPK